MRSPTKLSLGKEGNSLAFFDCKPFWSRQDLNSNTALPTTVGEVVKTPDGPKILAIQTGNLVWLQGVQKDSKVISSVSIYGRSVDSGEATAAMDRILRTNGSALLKHQNYFIKIVPMAHETHSELLMFDQSYQYESWRMQLAQIPVLFRDFKSRIEKISDIGKEGGARLVIGHVPSNKSMVLSRSYTGASAFEEAMKERAILQRLQKYKHFPKFLELHQVSTDEVVLVKEYLGGIPLSRWIKEFLPIEVKGPNDVIPLLRMMNELFVLVLTLQDEELSHGGLSADSLLVCPLKPVTLENLDSLDYLRKHTTRRLSLLHFSKMSDLSKSAAEPPDASLINSLKFSQYKAQATEDLFAVAKILQTILFGQDPNQVHDHSSILEGGSEDQNGIVENKPSASAMVKNGRVHLYNLDPDIFALLDDIIYSKPKKRPSPRECVFRVQRSLHMEAIKAKTSLLKKATLTGHNTLTPVMRKPSMNLNVFPVGKQSGISLDNATAELDELKSCKAPGGLDSSLGYGNTDSIISLKSLRSMKLNRMDRASSFAKKPQRISDVPGVGPSISKHIKLSASREPNRSPLHRTLRDLRSRHEQVGLQALKP